MSKTRTNDKTATPAGQNNAGNDGAGSVQLACKVLENGLLVGGCHHAKGKVLHLPADTAAELERRAKVEVIGA